MDGEPRNTGARVVREASRSAPALWSFRLKTQPLPALPDVPVVPLKTAVAFARRLASAKAVEGPAPYTHLVLTYLACGPPAPHVAPAGSRLYRGLAIRRSAGAPNQPRSTSNR